MKGKEEKGGGGTLVREKMEINTEEKRRRTLTVNPIGTNYKGSNPDEMRNQKTILIHSQDFKLLLSGPSEA